MALELWHISKRRGTRPSKRQEKKFLDRIDELEAENETLQDQVDSIADMIEAEEEHDDEGED